MDRQYWERRLWWAVYYAAHTADLEIYRRFEVIRQEALRRLEEQN